MHQPTHRATGFSLVELLVVIAIIGILSAIAVPAYTDYVTRGKITEAVAQLSDMRMKMEQFYQDNRAYGTAGTTCGQASPTTPAVKYFTFTCVTNTAMQGYTATATGGVATPVDVSMTGFVYTVTHANARATTITGGSKAALAGWTANANCWVTKKPNSC